MKQSRDFEDFYAANYGKTTALVAAIIGDWDEADDIAQEAFARALARWPRVSGYELPEGLGTAGRAAARHRFRPADPPDPAGHCRCCGRPGRTEAPDPGDSLAFTALGRVLSRIPLREREVLVLYYVADLSVEQIAHDRGIPAGTVKSRLAAGRRRLELGLAQDRAAQEEARDA